MTTATEVGYAEMRIAKVVGLATDEQQYALLRVAPELHCPAAEWVRY